MTDILVVNAELAVLVGSIAAIIVPTIMWLAFMVGRWSAWRWYKRNAPALAEEETRQRWENAVAVNAEKEREIEKLHEMIDGREARIKELVATVRAAQVQGVKQTEMLTLATEAVHAT